MYTKKTDIDSQHPSFWVVFLQPLLDLASHNINLQKLHFNSTILLMFSQIRRLRINYNFRRFSDRLQF